MKHQSLQSRVEAKIIIMILQDKIKEATDECIKFHISSKEFGKLVKRANEYK